MTTMMGAAAAAALAGAEVEAQALKPGINRVTFHSEGETLVGHLHLPASYRPGDRLPAVLVGGSWTTVKEQMADLYARRLAERGFAALSFDYRFWGESGGRPRQYESPEAKIADVVHAAEFLGSLDAVDPERVGGLAICASAGYFAHAIARGAKLHSFATVAAWLHDPGTVGQFYGGDEGVERRVALGRAARETFERTGDADYVPAQSEADPDAAMFFPIDYYTSPARGKVPAWTNRFAVMSWPEWLQFDAISPAPRITVPYLAVHSDQSALPDNLRRFHAAVAGPKTLVWTEGEQTQFYDLDPYVGRAVDAVAGHFRRTLAPGGAPPADAERARNRQVVEDFFAALEAMDLERFVGLWAEDGVQSMPFSPEGFPRRLEGREAVRNQYRSLPENYRSMRFPREILAMDDPARFVVRYTGEIELKDGGLYDNSYVGLFTVRDGQIAEFVEYFDPIILQRAFGDQLQQNFNVGAGQTGGGR